MTPAQDELHKLIPCKDCGSPTERQILVHGQCPCCRAHDIQQAKIDNDRDL